MKVQVSKRRHCARCGMDSRLKFCSMKCFRIFWRTVVLPRIVSSRKRTLVICAKCSKHFDKGESPHVKYCSDKCRRECIVGKGIRSGFIVCKCKECGDEFKQLSYHSPRKIYCTRKCWRRYFRRKGVIVVCRKRTKALLIRPNLPEQKLLRLLRPLGFKYVGDSKFWLGNKNPDFVHQSQALIVEMFGEHWHSRKEIPTRRLYFRRRGYRCLFIWNATIKRRPQVVVGQIERFLTRYGSASKPRLLKAS